MWTDAIGIYSIWDLELGLACGGLLCWWGWTCALHGWGFEGASCDFKKFDFWFPEGTRREEVDSQAVVTQHLKVSYGAMQPCATGFCWPWNTCKECYHSHSMKQNNITAARGQIQTSWELLLVLATQSPRGSSHCCWREAFLNSQLLTRIMQLKAHQPENSVVAFACLVLYSHFNLTFQPW